MPWPRGVHVHPLTRPGTETNAPATTIPTLTPCIGFAEKLPGVITLLPILKVFQLNLKSNYSPEVMAGY